MAAINDLVEVAGSMRISGRLGALSEAAAGIGAPFSVLYESVPRVTIPVSGMSMARADGPAEQSLPVDIYSLIEEVRRSIFELKAMTASVPEIYTCYIPPAMPVSPPAESPPAVYITERAVSADKKPEGVEHAGVAPSKPVRAMDDDIIRSNLALGKLREDYAGLTWDLTEIERLINEAMRSQAADIPAIVGTKAIPFIPETSIEYIERPAPETVVTEKTVVIRDETGKERPRDVEVSRQDTVVARPPKLASVLAQGISLPEIIRKSTVEMLVMQTVLAAEVPAPVMMGPVQAAAVPEPGQLMTAPVAGSSVAVPDIVPDKFFTKPASVSTPVAQALDIARMFNGLIGSYLAMRGTAPGRSAVKEGVTQLLLSLPEQQSVEGPVSGLFDVMAGLQAARPRPVETLRTIEIAAPGTSAPLSEGESMQTTILGDLREIHGTMLSLQDAVGGLRKAGLSPQEMPGAIESPALVRPEYEGVAGELSVIQASIARLQAAMDFLRVNVPTLADFVVLQKAVTGVTPVAVAMPEAGTPLAVAIEGVQPKSAAPISLPDISWVAREFGQMQGMIARLQVPMYAEGGLVQQPTLAFVGESEPEWIVPMSAWDASQTKLNEFYSMLWSQIQELGASMKDTVGGVNEALAGVQAGGGGGEEGSSSEDVGTQIEETVQGLVDKYLGMIGLSMDTLKNAQKTAGMGVVLGAATVALPYAKDTLLGKEEEEEKEDSGGDDGDEKEEEDDEEEFWDMIDDLDDAASISDKRDGKFDPDDE